MTNAQALAHDLAMWDKLEEFEKEFVADYIDCPSSPGCAWDGKTEHLDVCTACKIKWLDQESEEFPCEIT